MGTAMVHQVRCWRRPNPNRRYRCYYTFNSDSGGDYCSALLHLRPQQMDVATTGWLYPAVSLRCFRDLLAGVRVCQVDIMAAAGRRLHQGSTACMDLVFLFFHAKSLKVTVPKQMFDPSCIYWLEQINALLILSYS